MSEVLAKTKVNFNLSYKIVGQMSDSLMSFNKPEDRINQLLDKFEDQINKLGNMRKKATSIKENYDKKFQDLQESSDSQP